MYATGVNDEAARLTGVSIARLRFMGLIVSALVSTLAGIVLLLALGVTSPERGTAARRWITNRRERVASGEAAPVASTKPGAPS